MNGETIRLENLSIGYREKGKTSKSIAQDIEAVLRRGELTFLLGANGAGKSTLMRTISGFLPPLEGRVIIEGKDMNLFSNRELAKRIGVVLTERPELGRMTVNELVGMGRSPYTNFMGKLSDEDNAIVRRSLELVGMSDFGERMADTLSDGERQKAMIAKALAQETPIILLDEPTAFLDFPSKVEVMLLLRKLAHEEKKTIFLSTHDVELALQMADNLWLMKRGDYLKVGTPRELADNGVLDHFFRGENFRFDAKDMRFYVRIDK